MEIVTLETCRLRLRQWEEEDLPVFATLNADPEVMEFFPNILSRVGSNALAQRCKDNITEKGWGYWAVSLKSSDEFIGFVGVEHCKSYLPFSPCVEMSWRLRKEYWGRGYATEAAVEVRDFAFEMLLVQELVSFTAVPNIRSRGVMERLGMVNVNQNFMHPDVLDNHVLSEHVLYKITRSVWEKQLADSM